MYIVHKIFKKIFGIDYFSVVFFIKIFQRLTCDRECPVSHFADNPIVPRRSNEVAS